MTRLHSDTFMRMVALMVSMVFLGTLSFVPAQTTGLKWVRHSGAARGQQPTQSRNGDGMTAMFGFATAAGVAVGVLSRRPKSKTTRHYTTEQILPKMEWLSA